jgi:hypothetical protein
MTAPTKAQLAANVPPMIREYIDLAVEEAVKKARIESKMMNATMQQVADTLEVRIAEMELFEREVRSHLGVYVPE